MARRGIGNKTGGSIGVPTGDSTDMLTGGSTSFIGALIVRCLRGLLGRRLVIPCASIAGTLLCSSGWIAGRSLCLGA